MRPYRHVLSVFLSCPVAGSLSDLCNAEGDVCGSAEYVCQDNACLYKCEFLACGQHGQCYVRQLDGVSKAMCRYVDESGEEREK